MACVCVDLEELPAPLVHAQKWQLLWLEFSIVQTLFGWSLWMRHPQLFSKLMNCGGIHSSQLMCDLKKRVHQVLRRDFRAKAQYGRGSRWSASSPLTCCYQTSGTSNSDSVDSAPVETLRTKELRVHYTDLKVVTTQSC